MTGAIPPLATAELDAQALLDAAGAAALLPGIAQMEGVSTVSLAVLRGLGMGSSSGVRLVDCVTATDVATERRLVARELVALDSRLSVGAYGETDADRAKFAVVAAARLVGVIVDAMRTKEGEAAARLAGESSTAYVVTQTEEERGFSLPSLSNEDIKRQKTVLSHMYNMHATKPHNMPTIAGMRRIAYWVKNENSWPDPARVSLDSMRRDPTDSALLKFRRIVYGVMVVAAGEKVAEGTRHEGAGGSKKFPAQWADGDILEELLLELTEAADRLPNTEMETVVSVMHESLYKATSRGNESVSLAASRQMCKVVDYVAQSKMATAAAASAHGPGSSSGGRSPARPAGSSKKRGTPAPAPDRPSPKPKAAKQAKPSKWADEEGALGPNGLARKKGGNSAGAPCERLAKGECPFKTCSYSHS